MCGAPERGDWARAAGSGVSAKRRFRQLEAVCGDYARAVQFRISKVDMDMLKDMACLLSAS
jgi:hypothetical protein